MSYNFHNRKWGQDDLGRGSGEITWTMSLAGLQYDSTRFPSLTLADFEAAIRAAFGAWEHVANIDFTEIPNPDGTLGDADVDMDLEFLSLSGSTVGVANTTYRNGSNDGDNIDVIVDVSIDFDSTTTWVPDGGPGGVSLFAVAVHEIGHGLGLGHVDDTSEILNPFVSADELGDGDIEGIQLIYGARVPEDTGPPIAGTNQNGGAGNDNLTGNAGADVLVDTLGTNSLFGGAGNDLIIGGSGKTTGNGDAGNDVVLGGIGDDVLRGGSGNDTLRGDPSESFFFGDDVLSAGAGTDYLEGGGGVDVFIFNPNEGTNYIARLGIDKGDPSNTTTIGADFDSGIDQVDLSTFNYANAAEAFDNVKNISGHAVFQDQAIAIHFIGLTTYDLSEGDFIV